MTDLVIVADDLTGAGDSAAYLATIASVSVVLDGSAQWPDATVVAVDTDSRYLEPPLAASRTADAVLRGHGLGATIFKKIDSTLRGNVAVEVRAAAEALASVGDRPLVIVAPAFPEVGRTTLDGIVHVKGDPLTNGPYRGNLQSMLSTVGLMSTLIPLKQLRSTPNLDEAFLTAYRGGVDAIVVDADSDEDLAAVVRGARSASFPTLLVGSGGLARPLGRHLSKSQGQESVAFTLAAPALFVVGSYAIEARNQRAALVGHGVEEMLVAAGASDDLASARLRTMLARGNTVISPRPDIPIEIELASNVADALASLTHSVLDLVKTLVVTGGATARAMLGKFGITQLEVKGELEAGLVLYHVGALNLDLVTKAGAFGDTDTLLRCHLATQRKET